MLGTHTSEDDAMLSLSVCTAHLAKPLGKSCD